MKRSLFYFGIIPVVLLSILTIQAKAVPEKRFRWSLQHNEMISDFRRYRLNFWPPLRFRNLDFDKPWGFLPRIRAE